MDPVEKAIRNALEKGNAGDRAFREKVYRSAFAALERATQSQPQLTVEMAIKRRQHLQAKITSIEAEYLPSPPPLPVEPADVEDFTIPDLQVVHAPDTPAVDTPAVAAEGNVQEAPSVFVDHGEPVSEAPVPDLGSPVDSSLPGNDFPVNATVAPDRDERRASRRRRPVAALFMIVTLLCVAILGALWAYQTGLFSFGPDEPSRPRLSEEEEFDPDEEMPLQPGAPGGMQELGNWTVVFSPNDLSGVNAPTGATAEAGSDESGSFLRIRSGETGASIVFDVRQDVLESIVGKKAVFNISARTEEGSQTQISVNCDFGELGDCGRKRYAVGYERGEYLFDVSLSENRPGAGGSIAINSDFSNEGKSVDIYEIRVSVVE